MRNISVITGLPFEIPGIEDITDQLPKHKEKVWQTRRNEDIDTLIVHHMASESPLLNQALYHVNGRDWAALGYHMVVDRVKLFQTNDLKSFTNHASGWNHRAVGISIRGDLSKRPMTDTERQLLYAGIFTVKALLPIKRILGHNEASKEAGKPGTACPATSMERIRADIQALEEQLSYREVNADKVKVDEMIRRIGDLYDKYRNPESPHQFEATRKLAVIHDVLTERKWF